jgi:uncharacterized protein YlxP (DUF503 family)
MTVGALRVELFIADSDSLKSKRAVIKALKERIKNNFNVSVSEVDGHDKWQRAVLGLAAVGPDKRRVNSVLDKVLDHIRHNREVHLLNFDMEIL